MPIIFLDQKLVIRSHSKLVKRFGGISGLRDDNLLISALARARQKATYGCHDICELAAAYLFGISKNMAFVDGNKRASLLIATVFLKENGYEIEATDAHLYALTLGVANGEIDEEGATRFFRDFAKPRT
ncbi:type II toxin-antitoxin system death-on-curing family toxin [Rhizobium sp. BR 362]|uniref:type II toxin-antitoxin system death-on-curing family toxin n=1 Tax=Rhizobium sp. BR 362 TaxID=3040670 RepID=UPI002F3E7FB8